MKNLKKIIVALAMVAMIPALPASAAYPSPLANYVIKGSAPQIYYVLKSGGLLSFPDEITYKSWYHDFTNVVTVPDAQITAMPHVGTVTIKPGLYPIKAGADRTVYAVARYGVIRPFATPNAARIVYGNDWPKKVVTVPASSLANYVKGEPVVGPDQYWWTRELASMKTIENDYDATLNGVHYQNVGAGNPATAQLTLKAVVINDGAQGRVNATDSDTLLFIGALPVRSGKAYAIAPGDYTVYQNEAHIQGYVISNWTGDCNAGVNHEGYIHLNADDKKTCTITYTYSPDAAKDPILTIHVNVVNAHPEKGTAAPADFTIVVGSDQVVPEVPRSYAPGWYNVKSFNHMFDYSPLGLSGDCNPDGTIEMRLGHTYSCTFGWTYIKPGDFRPTMGEMVLSAMIVGGTAQPSDVRFFVEGKPVSSGQIIDVDPRDYTVYHSALAGYTASDWQGSCNAAGQVHGEVNQLKSCVVIFTKQ